MELEIVVSGHFAVKMKLGLESFLDRAGKKGRSWPEEGGFYRNPGVEKSRDVWRADLNAGPNSHFRVRS